MQDANSFPFSHAIDLMPVLSFKDMLSIWPTWFLRTIFRKLFLGHLLFLEAGGRAGVFKWY